MRPFEVIKNKDNWCVGKYASDVCGRDLFTDSPLATKFCFIGAICKATGQDAADVENALKSAGIRPPERGWDYFSIWNDKSTHRRVFSFLKKIDNDLRAIGL